jgi:flagellar protein FlaI
MDERLLRIEDAVLEGLAGRFIDVTGTEERRGLVRAAAREIDSALGDDDIEKLFNDMNDIGVVGKLIYDEEIEDVMINNTSNIFVTSMKLYATNMEYGGRIFDVQLPSRSRANVVASPLGYNITIRNFKRVTMSILDLINLGTLDYSMAARLWLYVDGLKIRPANILIGGIPSAGKTTTLNSMFSFFRPEQRIVTIEETYELNTMMQENCVNLQTSEDLPMEALVKTALRMRPDMIIIGEVRGPEANDMMTAMNIGKIAMATIHASSPRDIVNRLEHTPMKVPLDIIPVVDVLITESIIRAGQGRAPARKITQVSEISGMETNVLLSDLYKFDYKTMKGSPILPSVTYRDMLAKLAGVAPTDILSEELVRATILQRLNETGKRDIKSISEVVRDYYFSPDQTLKKLEIKGEPAIRI